MSTKEQIEAEHNANIQNIRASHLDRHEISHEEYHNQLNAANERYQAELIAEGFLEPPPGSTEARDLRADIDVIKTDIETIKTKVGMK